LRKLHHRRRRAQKGRDTNCAPLTVAVLDAGGHLVAFNARQVRPAAFDIATARPGRARHGLRLAHAAARAGKTPQFFTMLAAASAAHGHQSGGVLIRDAAGDIIGAVAFPATPPTRRSLRARRHRGAGLKATLGRMGEGL